MVVSELVLTHYYPSLPLKLATDASPYGLGAVISHVTEEGERPISFASRTLSKAEQGYSQLDKKALAIVWAVKKFLFYLCGRHFTLITDHQPLKYIFSPDKGIPAMSAVRQQRYAVFLSGFNYSIEYRNSKANANADSLSRLPLPVSDTDSETIDDTDELYYQEVVDSIPVSANSIAKESRHDFTIARVLNYVTKDDWIAQNHYTIFCRTTLHSIATDASPYGLGAVISHVTEEGERPISFASRTLSKAEQGYSQLDKEALAIVWAVKKFFYLCGRHFTLPDHQPLKYIFSPDKGIPAMSAARQQRYAVFLSGFNYSIEYRNSKANANVDSLSRLPLPVSDTESESETSDDTDELYYQEVVESIPVSAKPITKVSRHDLTIARVLSFVIKDDWPSSIEPELRPFTSEDMNLVYNKNVYSGAIESFHHGNSNNKYCKHCTKAIWELLK
ncbi:hypothetical protein EGW08_006261 [Elysia chlorotica]|uniref:Reverse transcriptase RNase H-like domain-containing protein n=1 Tax=Elysia chlorotica TaxID=188477 RepID=A0A433TWL7_ELYCH|nr:hypothetical protein EGW08_006261 [Elysia chlorotica]